MLTLFINKLQKIQGALGGHKELGLHQSNRWINEKGTIHNQSSVQFTAFHIDAKLKLWALCVDVLFYVGRLVFCLVDVLIQGMIGYDLQRFISQIILDLDTNLIFSFLEIIDSDYLSRFRYFPILGIGNPFVPCTAQLSLFLAV